jgi:hypothetical protein
MPLPLAAAIGAAIYILGRIILQFAIKVGTRIMTRYILPVVRASLRWLKEEAIDIGTTALFAAIQYVLDFLTGSTEELGKYINEKSSLLPKQGSPNPTTGRQPNYRHFYRRPIPYRPIICRILCFANSNPIPGKRTKKGDKTKPESTTGDFPKLRQLAATILFELLDMMLDWKSPLKADLMYRGGQPLLTQPDFRPKRVGFSYKRKEAGSISPDIAIVEDRHKPPTLDNLFAIVEVKFKGDGFDFEQERAYAENFKGVPLALIRVPEDCRCDDQEIKTDGKNGKDQNDQKNGSSRRRKRFSLPDFF